MSERKKPVKATKLVVQAIKHLKTKRGFTPKEIINYVQANHEVNSRTVKSIYTALRRGEDYGILRADRGKYALAATGTLSHLLARRHTEDDYEDPGYKGLCKPRKSRMRRSRRGKSRACRCGKRRRGGRRRSRSRRGGRCKKRGSRRRRSRRRRGGKRSCGCGSGKRRRRGGRRSGRRKCGGGGRRRRRRASRSRRRRSKSRC